MNELATIRRAYRYIVAYERRVLDAIARVDVAIRDAGFERNTPHRWKPLYRSFPSREWSPDRWAWDHVPCYAFRYQWRLGEKNASGSRYVFVEHIADTAFETKRLTDGAEPEPLTGLPSVESSRSVLRWAVVEQRAVFPDAIWQLDWLQLLSKHFGVAPSELYPTTEAVEPARREREGLRATTWIIDLETLDGPESLESRFISLLRLALQPDQPTPQ